MEKLPEQGSTTPQLISLATVLQGSIHMSKPVTSTLVTHRCSASQALMGTTGARERLSGKQPVPAAQQALASAEPRRVCASGSGRQAG